jgi:Tfp pilus assembly protein PilX
MNFKRHNHRNRPESGVALLIAIFVLMLISVVAISLIVASGGESALAGNYRSSASAYLAGTAGLEEARGRLLPKNADYFNTTTANFIPTAGPLAVGQVRYILNPAPGEALSSLLATYPDTQYATEFGAAPVSTNTQTIASVSTVTSGGTTFYGPLYKWVRINAATEASLGTDVNRDTIFDSTTPLYFDPTHLNGAGAVQPTLIVPPMVGGVPNLTATPYAKQALEVTTLAVLPDGSKKTLQYVVAPVSLPMNFPSALTLAGNSIAFNGANSNQYYVNGTDGSGNPPAVAGCTPTGVSLPAVGTTGTSNVTSVDGGIPSNRDSHYTGGGLGTPSVGNVTLTGALQTPASLDQMIQTITANADLVINGNATNANMPSNMSATNPMTVVVNGDFSMSGNYNGYGLLVVTGNFTYTGNTGWAGIVLVIGEGTTVFAGSGGGNAEFDGAIFTATTRDTSGNELNSLGNVGFDISGGGGNGIYYNSCWINQANQPPAYQVLSFRELH